MIHQVDEFLLRDVLYDILVNPIEEALWNSTRAKVKYSIGNMFDNSVEDIVWSTVWVSVRNPIDDSIFHTTRSMK